MARYILKLRNKDSSIGRVLGQISREPELRPVLGQQLVIKRKIYVVTQEIDDVLILDPINENYPYRNKNRFK